MAFLISEKAFGIAPKCLVLPPVMPYTAVNYLNIAFYKFPLLIIEFNKALSGP